MAHYIDSFPDREITINGAKHLYFGGTSYLGLQTNNDFQNLLINNIKKYGTNYGASRKSNVRLSIYKKTEQYLADIVGSESCITLSSGFLVGQLLTTYYNTPKYQLFYTPNTHVALQQQNTNNYITYSSLAKDISAHIKSNNKKTPIILLDSIDFHGDNYPDFKFLNNLPFKDCILIVDDSHGIGILGDNGGGVFEILKKYNPKEIIVCCSLGKGLAVQAGAIFGTTKTINNLKKTAFFGGASPATPANIATILDAKTIYKEKRDILHSYTSYFISKVEDLNYFTFVKGHPTFTFRNKKLSNHLLKNRIIVTDFNYPNEDSPLMSRIVLSASHKKEDIQHLIKCINTLL